eukprot:PITA_28738
MIEVAFDSELEEDPLKDPHDQTIPVIVVSNSKVVEIEPGKTLNINTNLAPDQEIKLVNLLQKYKGAFVWDYLDMKGIDPQLCTHHIYIEKDARPVRQPQRRLNPNLKEIVKAELQKLLDVNFIYPISDSKWVSPLVVVPKKNGKWRICMDYRELNKATQKDHFPLPFIDQVLDTLAGKNFFSFLDGFSGYNQIQIAPEDKDKTTFTCPWGMFAYRVLPFGLCNAPATFQRAVLNIFADLINDRLEVYMDEFTPYGEDFDPAPDTLEKVLQRCIATRLCLSHEKCYMMMTEGLILGHYISAAGIQVDPTKIQILLLIPTPTTQTEVRSFLGFFGYYRRFIEHYSRIVAPLYALTGNVDFLWTEKCNQDFKELKKLVSTAPVLRGPNWNLPFQISSDASDTAIGAVLGKEEDKKPYAIYYISKNLSSAELNYTVTEKEFLAIIHAVNKFRHYITGYPVVLYTDHSAIKYLANKPVTNARITRWLILLQEFDITIKDRPSKENPVADFLSRIPKSIETTAVEDQFPDEHLFVVVVRTPWYADVADYLAVGKLPKHLTPQERKQIVQKSTRFSWIRGNLFHTRAYMQIRSCQRAGKPGQADETPLRPQLVIEPFERWALDFVGPINPPSDQRTYILVATDYVTKWVEVESLPKATEDSVIQFLFHLFVRYGLPREVITDGVPQFVGNKLAATLNNSHVQHKITTPYHLHANGQVESSNKVIESILTKTIAVHRRDWAARLPEALWAYRTTWRSTTGYSPYQLVFGKQPIFPIEFEIQTLRTAQEVGLDLSEAQINRLQQVNELDEIRLSVLQNTTLIQQQRAKWHDALINNKVFHEGDWALLYDSRFQDFPRKLQTQWLGPYEIQKVHDNGTLTLITIDGSRYAFKVNGHRVRLYRKTLTRESFCQQL